MEYTHIVKGRRNTNALVTATFEPCGLTLTLRLNNDQDPGPFVYESFRYSFDHPLQRGLNIKKGAANSFRLLYKNIHLNLFKTIWEEVTTVNMPGELRTLHAFLVRMQDIFLSTLNPEYVKICRKFRSSRMQYYNFLQTYDCPRVRQMFETSPALISLIVVGMEVNLLNGRALKSAVRMIKDGVKLRKIYAWLFNHLLFHTKHGACNFNFWTMAREHAQHRWDQMQKDWIWLLENADRKTSGRVLLMPPPYYLPKNQIPKSMRMRPDWYKRIRSFSFMIFPEATPSLIEKKIKGFILMASQADEKFNKYVSRRKTGVLDFLRYENRFPNGKTNYREFFRESTRYYKENRYDGDYAREKKLALKLVKEGSNVQDCTWSYEDSEITIRPLVTWDDFQNESKLMSNCMRKLWYEAYQKNRIYFHVTHEGKDYSLDVSVSVMRLMDLKGFRNSEAPAYLTAKIDAVLEEQRETLRTSLTEAGYKVASDEGLGTGSTRDLLPFFRTLTDVPDNETLPF